MQNDVAQAAHLIGTKRHRPLRAHFHAGPAVVVMGGRHHGDRRHVEVELREISHWGQRKANIVNFYARRHEPDRQRLFDGSRIGAKIVAGHDVRRHAELAYQRAETESQRLHAHQVDFLPQQPARVVFAKAGGLHQRLGFIGIGVGRERGLRLGEHQRFLIADRCARAS